MLRIRLCAALFLSWTPFGTAERHMRRTPATTSNTGCPCTSQCNSLLSASWCHAQCNSGGGCLCKDGYWDYCDQPGRLVGAEYHRESMTSVSSENKKLTKDNLELTQENTKQTGYLKTLSLEKKRLVEENEALHEENEDTRDEITNLNSKKQTLKGEITKFTNEKKELVAEKIELYRDVSTKKNQIIIISCVATVAFIVACAIGSTCWDKGRRLQHAFNALRFATDTCPVCFGDFGQQQRVFAHPCGHAVCQECSELIQLRDSCPVCRQPNPVYQTAQQLTATAA